MSKVFNETQQNKSRKMESTFKRKENHDSLCRVNGCLI